MPNHRTALRWDHPTYRFAYVREYRGMACTVIHGSPPISTGFKWHPASRDQALKILNARLSVYLYGQVAQDTTTMTCADLFEEFVKVRFGKISRNMQGEYERYMQAFVPGNMLVTSTKAIRDAILSNVADSHYHHNTRRKGLKRVRSVFAFGIDEGWLKVNPVNRDMIPSERRSTPQPYTEEQLSQALDQLHGRNKAFVEFLIATGCRAKEARDAKWEHVKADHIVLDGKRNKQDVPVFRVIPFVLCPDLPRIIERARTAEWRGPEYIFGVTNYQPIARALKEALPEANGFHNIRKHVINKWIRKGWPVTVLDAMAGHDERIRGDHYEVPFSADELVRLALDSTPEKPLATRANHQ
jgi:integrase